MRVTICRLCTAQVPSLIAFTSHSPLFLSKELPPGIEARDAIDPVLLRLRELRVVVGGLHLHELVHDDAHAQVHNEPPLLFSEVSVPRHVAEEEVEHEEGNPEP